MQSFICAVAKKIRGTLAIALKMDNAMPDITATDT